MLKTSNVARSCALAKHLMRATLSVLTASVSQGQGPLSRTIFLVSRVVWHGDKCAFYIPRA